MEIRNLLALRIPEILAGCTHNVWLWEYSLVYVAENAYIHVYDSTLLGCGLQHFEG
jgi:hypothetical protein